MEVFPVEYYVLDNEEVLVDLSEDVPAVGVVYDGLEAIAPDEEFPDEVGFYQNVEMQAEISAELEVVAEVEEDNDDLYYVNPLWNVDDWDKDTDVKEDNEDMVAVYYESPVDQENADEEEEEVLIVDLEEDIVREEEEEPLN
jgi:hypothetical protein